MPLPGQTGRQRHSVLNLSIYLSVIKLVNMIFLNRINQFWCRVAQVVHKARAWNLQLCGSAAHRLRSREAEDRFEGLAETSFSTSLRWVYILQGISEKSSPQKKLFGIFSLRPIFLCEILQICWQFISTCIYQFLYIYLNISSNGVNFSTSTHRFHLANFWVFTHKMKMPRQVSLGLVYAEWLSQCGRLDCRLS